MAKIGLVSCNVTKEPYPIYPLGMTLVAEAAKAAGHEVHELDLLASEPWELSLPAFIAENAPDYIGLSLRNVDTVNYNRQESYTALYAETVRLIRTLTSSPVILGGAAYSLFPDALLTATGADYGIAGEGEKAFLGLVSSLEKGEKIPRRVIAGTPIPGKDIPVCGRNHALAGFYLHKGGMLNIQTKRGCPHRCIYCSYPHLEGRRYRFRNPEDVAEEIGLLREHYGMDYFSITDSVFNDSTGHYLDIAEALVKKDLSIPWMCFMRPQRFRKEEIDLLKQAGLSAVEWGTDASSDATLAGMQKSFLWNEVEDANARFAGAGIANSHFIIFGGPGETQKTVREGLRNIGRLERCVVFASIGIRVFPHTPIHAALLENGSLSPETDLLKPYFYFSPEINPHMLHDTLTSSFEGRQDRIYPEGGQLEKIQAFHDLGYRGPVWDLILGTGRTRRSR